MALISQETSVQGGVPDRLYGLLSLGSLTPTRARAEHLDDGVGSNGGKAVCDGADGELFDGLLDFLHPNHIVFLCRDTDIGVLVEDLVDWDQMLIPIIVTVGM